MLKNDREFARALGWLWLAAVALWLVLAWLVTELEESVMSDPTIWTIAGAGIIGFLSGVGSFQFLVAGEVKAHGIELQNMKEQIKADKELNEQRIGNVVVLMEAQGKSTVDLISLVREQNRLIERFYIASKVNNDK